MKNAMYMGVLAAIVAAAFPDLSFAASIGSSMGQFYNQDLKEVPKLVSGVAYIGGAVLAFSGALKLKAHAENPGQNPMAPGIGRLLAGGGLAALPSLLATASSTGHLSETGAVHNAAGLQITGP